MRRFLYAVLVVLVGATTVVIAYAVDGSASTDGDARGPGLVTVVLGIEHSRFSTDRVRVVAGSTVRFVVENHDPINHELVVGGDAVHARHERGTEASHPPVPGEVSVGPDDDGVTFLRFGKPGEYEYACHLPGHLAYGMRGTVEVVPQ